MISKIKTRKKSVQAWPPNYIKVFQSRLKLLVTIRKTPSLVRKYLNDYKDNPIDFIEKWCYTHDPRNASKEDGLTTIPFILFEKQKELVRFLQAMVKEQQSGLIEKARDMGATWVCCAFSVWLWLFWDGATIGWGSRKAILVDRIGVPDSIFEKMRQIIRDLPKEFLPKNFNEKFHMTHMKIINPTNGATIIGESGDDIGRGGRSLIFFKDESAHYEHPNKIEGALGDNTPCQIDISSVNGIGNVYYCKRHAGVEWRDEGPVVKNKANVFIMKWEDHPLKTLEWYNVRKEKAKSEGLLHLFAQEVDRNYSAAIVNTIIPAEWVKSSIDAHIKLDFDSSETWIGGLDVAGVGKDKNAFACRKGVVLEELYEWSDLDTGVTARKVAGFCEGKGRIEVQYDCIGVGEGVKAESNRLVADGKMPVGVKFVAWNASASPQNKKRPTNENDNQSPKNGDFYENLKAQGWWELRRRFEKTFKMVNKIDEYPKDELISISSNLSSLNSLMQELSQPTIGKSSNMKLKVEKAPEGMMSPNLADAVMMAFWPIKSYNISYRRLPDFLIKEYK